MTNKPVGHADDGSRKEKILRVRLRWIIRGLGAILTVVCMSGRLQIAAAEDSETAKDIIATQIRSEGYFCKCRRLQAR